DALEASLISGDWAYGEQLPAERALAERFGVGRPLIREVLRRLGERGLVETKPGRGTFVRELQPSNGMAAPEVFARRGEVTARHVIDARRALESEAAALAATQRSPEDLTGLGELLSAFERADDVAAATELDVAFHEAVVGASRNTVLQILCGSIRSLTYALVLRSHTDRLVNDASFGFHRATYAAIAAGDVNGAREAAARHFTSGEQRYGPDLDRPLRDALRRQADAEPRVARLLRRASDSVHMASWGDSLQPTAPATGPGGRADAVT
ncbi:MAG TPA: FCD domain-containing protein, partial [Acidimicrobiales bacterium]|nr:FCD domain-containing protein [Acidimicrobiales bacterium]